MKNKTLITALLVLCFTLPSQAQFLKKLKQKAEQAAERTILRKTDEVVSQKTEKTIDDATTQKSKPQQAELKTLEPANTALHKNTSAKRKIYKEDVIIKLHENGKLNQTQFFDANEIAVKLENSMPKPGYIDSEGFIYGYNNGEYTKSSMLALQSQGLMVPTMLVDAYKLPPEPVMASLQKQNDLGITANPFNGIVEFAFIYKPEHFKYENFKETKQTLRGKTYTKFEFLNEPGYEGSYVLFDNQNRLVEIYTKISESTKGNQIGEMPRQQGENLIIYDYKPVEVNLPVAREVRTLGQDLMQGVMGGIVKDGNLPKDEIDENDYGTNNNKGMTKRAKKSLKNHKITANDLPDTYNFDWVLQTEMVLNAKKKEIVNLTFLIKKTAQYQATKMSSESTKAMGETFMIFDLELKSTLMLIETQGHKFMQIHPIPNSKNTAEKTDRYKITELPSKNIIGYNCKGLQFEDDRYIMKIYHTTEAKITLSHFLNFGSQKTMDFPDIDPKVAKQFSNGLIMEMDIVDKKKSKNNVNITAKALSQTPTVISPKKYQVMDLFSETRILKN